MFQLLAGNLRVFLRKTAAASESRDIYLRAKEGGTYRRRRRWFTREGCFLKFQWREGGSYRLDALLADVFNYFLCLYREV